MYFNHNLKKAMTQWRLVNGNQSVPIEKFLEMVGNTASTSSTTAPSTQVNNTANITGVNVANSSILISSAPNNTKITSQNVQINQQLVNVNQSIQNKNQNTINGLPIIASIAPNTLLPQSQNVVIIVSFIFKSNNTWHYNLPILVAKKVFLVQRS
jgi:hypothetical protein